MDENDAEQVVRAMKAEQQTILTRKKLRKANQNRDISLNSFRYGIFCWILKKGGGCKSPFSPNFCRMICLVWILFCAFRLGNV